MRLVAVRTLSASARQAFDAFEANATALMAAYGGAVERKIIAHCDAEQLREIDLVRFPDEQSFAAYRRDPRRGEPVAESEILRAVTFERWQAAWRTLGLGADQDLYEELLKRYCEPHRHYHTLAHLEQCLQEASAVQALAHPSAHPGDAARVAAPRQGRGAPRRCRSFHPRRRAGALRRLRSRHPRRIRLGAASRLPA